jgi:hypothetical protein
MDAEGPGDCGSGVFAAQEVNGIGDRWPGDTTTVDADTHTLGGLQDLGLFSSSAEVTRFLEKQHLDQRNSVAL